MRTSALAVALTLLPLLARAEITSLSRTFDGGTIHHPLVCTTSVTASAFFGDASHMTGVGFSGGSVANETDFLSTVTVHGAVKINGVLTAAYGINEQKVTIGNSNTDDGNPSSYGVITGVENMAGAANASIFGFQNTTGGGSNAVIVGRDNFAYGTALGADNSIGGVSTVGAGYSNTTCSTCNYSGTFGTADYVGGAGSFAFGNNIINTHVGSVQIGGSDAAKIEVDATGDLLVPSSVTASAFFGDGSHLVNLPATTAGGANDVIYNSAGNLTGDSSFQYFGGALRLNSGDFQFGGGVIYYAGADLVLKAGGNVVETLHSDYSVDFASAVTATRYFGSGAGLTDLPAPAGTVLLASTQTLSGGNALYGSTTFYNYVNIATGTYYAGSTPPGKPGAGALYFDSATQVFMVKENNGAAKPIVDPPGNWTCTIRSGAGSTFNSSYGTDTASCTGSEKALSGGCLWDTMGTLTSQVAPQGAPTGQGWQCGGYNASGTNRTLTAYANCCK